MPVRVGINGFGRIGRQVLKAILERHPQTLEVAAINDLFDTKTNAHLFKYDTNYGVYPGTVEAHESSFVIDGREIRVRAERGPDHGSGGKRGALRSEAAQRRVQRLVHYQWAGAGRQGAERSLGHRE